MELRVVELAHAKGLTMADIAKQIGISRVKLSNSLNGNPPLSRLAEVAQILGVEVSELFKPTTTGKAVSGYLEFNGRIVKVDSLDTVKRFIADVEAE
jgi:transcriptional regulator with XRE-family HTH domain